jgi:hypothetical protein
MEPTEDSETSVVFKRTPGIYPKERTPYSKPDESLKSRILRLYGEDVSTHIRRLKKLRIKMEPTEDSETSAVLKRTPGIYPKEHTKYGAVLLYLVHTRALMTLFYLKISPLHCILTLILLTWTKWWVPASASKWRMGFNSAFKGLPSLYSHCTLLHVSDLKRPFTMSTVNRMLSRCEYQIKDQLSSWQLSCNTQQTALESGVYSCAHILLTLLTKCTSTRYGWPHWGPKHVAAYSVNKMVFIYIYYLFTPWSRVLIEKLTGFATNKEIPPHFM